MNGTTSPFDLSEQKPKNRFMPIFIGLGYMALHYAILLLVQLIALFHFTDKATEQLGSGASKEEIAELAETLFYGRANLISIITQFTTILIVVAIFFIIRALKREEKPCFTTYFSLKKVPFPQLRASFFLAIFLYFAVIGLLTVIGLVFPKLLESYKESMTNSSQDPSWILNFITLVIGAPLVEELIYRNMAITNLSKKLSPIVAVLISSAIFGIAHGNPIQIVYAACVGVVFGVIFIRTESILPSLLGHAVFNGIGFAVSVIVAYFPEDDPVFMAYSVAAVLMIPLSLIGGPIALVRLIRMTKKSSPFNQNPMFFMVNTGDTPYNGSQANGYNASQGTNPQMQGWYFDPRYGWCRQAPDNKTDTSDTPPSGAPFNG